MTILEEAAKIVDSRPDTYGPPAESFQRLAKVWSAILEVEVSTSNAVLCLVAMKMLRLTISPNHRDSQIDICGYARILEMISEKASS
jgi:hypothetical protein